MGDRANLGFSTTTGSDECVWLYTHWHGTSLPAMAVRAVAAARPRWGDEPYATRIALTVLIGAITDPTGWGVSTGPGDNEHDGIVIDWDERVYRVLPAGTVAEWYQMGPVSRAAAIAAAPVLPFDGTGSDTFRGVWS